MHSSHSSTFLFFSLTSFGSNPCSLDPYTAHAYTSPLPSTSTGVSIEYSNASTGVPSRFHLAYSSWNLPLRPVTLTHLSKSIHVCHFPS